MTWKQYAIGSLVGIFLGSMGMREYRRRAEEKFYEDITAKLDEKEKVVADWKQCGLELAKCQDMRRLLALCLADDPTRYFTDNEKDYNERILFLTECVLKKNISPSQKSNSLEYLEYNEFGR